MIKNLFWDLDGTLTDSSEGILNSVKLVFEQFGIHGYEEQELTCFIGPPLRESFPKFGIEASRIEEAIEVFRGRYTTIGKFENRPYDGIGELLGKLKEEGFRLFVATSKPEETAKQILDKFDLTQYFEIICGATMDGRIDTKEEVIRYLLSVLGDTKEALMIGDTKYDVHGAAVFGIDTVGVTWGFGSREELLAAGAARVVDSMDELYTVLTKG